MRLFDKLKRKNKRDLKYNHDDKNLFIIVFKTIIMFLIFMGISILLRYLYSSFWDILTPTQETSYENYISNLMNEIICDSIHIVFCMIIDFIALIIGYFIVFKKQIALKKYKKLRLATLLIGYFIVLFLNIWPFTTWDTNYTILFFHIVSFIEIGILLISTSIICFILYKSIFLKKYKFLLSLFIVNLFIGICCLFTGIYRINICSNPSYIEQYLSKLNIKHEIRH